VKGEEVQVTWDNPEELEKYIHKLQAAAERLTSENRRLRKCHYTVSDKVHPFIVIVWGYTVSDKVGPFTVTVCGYTFIDKLLCDSFGPYFIKK